MIYLNSENSSPSWNKTDYLLEEDRKLNLNIFKRYKGEADVEAVLNIQPFGDVISGTKWTGIWHIDVSMNSHIPNFYQGVNTVFVASTSGIKPYDKQTILFQACNEDLDKRYPEIKQEFDFVSCGTGGQKNGEGYGRRYDVFTSLKENFTFGDFGKGLPPQEYIKKINTAKVQVVQPFTPSGKPGMCAQRFFECLAIGPVLCDKVPDLDHLNLVEGEDYLSYSNLVELNDKMKLLVENEDLRNKIALSGRNKALLYHTYKHRLISILNIVNEYTFCPTQ